MRNFGRRYGGTIAWAMMLFVFSSIPDLSPPLHLSRWDDKFQHMLAYVPLGWLLMRSIAWNNDNSRKALWLTLLFGSLYGISDEIHQYFVPGRMMDWRDVLADAAGVALGACFFYHRRRRKLGQQQKATVQPGREKSNPNEANSQLFYSQAAVFCRQAYPATRDCWEHGFGLRTRQ